MSSSGSRRWRWLAAVVVAALGASLLAPAAGAAPTLSVVASSIEGWTVESGTAKEFVGRVKAEGLPTTKRSQFAMTSASDVTSGTVLADGIFTVRNNGRVSYNGDAIAGSTVTLNVSVTDSKGRAAAITTAITVTVTQPAGSIQLINGWTVESGTAKKIVGKVKAEGLPTRRSQFAMTSARDATSGTALADGIFTVRNNGRVSYSGAAIAGSTVTLNVSVTDSRGKVADITAVITVTVTQPAALSRQESAQTQNTPEPAQAQTQRQTQRAATELEKLCARNNGFKGRPPSQRARCDGVGWEQRFHPNLICDTHTHTYTYTNPPTGHKRLPLTWEVTTRVQRAGANSYSFVDATVKTVTLSATLTETPFDGKTYKIIHTHSPMKVYQGKDSACPEETSAAEHDLHDGDFGEETDPPDGELLGPSDFATARAYWVYKWKQRQNIELTSAALRKARWFDCMTHVHLGRRTVNGKVTTSKITHSSCDGGDHAHTKDGDFSASHTHTHTISGTEYGRADLGNFGTLAWQIEGSKGPLSS